MQKELYIQSACSITHKGVVIDGKPIIRNTAKENDFGAFAKMLYTHLDLKYSKFHKMDDLSKLGFLTAEFLFQKNAKPTQATLDMAVLLTNHSSSIHTDRSHQERIENMSHFYPSPAIFVYTLANICLGEISIRHNLKGESGFFISDDFDPHFLFTYTQSLYKSNKCSSALCGWVNFDQGKAESFLYLASQKEGLPHTASTIEDLYTKNAWKN